MELFILLSISEDQEDKRKKPALEQHYHQKNDLVATERIRKRILGANPANQNLIYCHRNPL